jgi:serine/threonine protein kinase
MSPEQAVNSRDIDHRADLWSLGMVAFEALTGRRAIEVDGLGAMILALHSSRLPVPSQYEPSLPAAVDAWFTMACARVPQERFPSAREMAVALARALGEGPVYTPLPSSVVVTPPLPSSLGAYSPPPARGSAPQPPEAARSAAAPQASKSAPTLALPSGELPKVPSLAPPPLRPPPREPDPPDEAWKSQITRNAPVARVAVAPAPERSSRRTLAPPEPEERPRSLRGLVILGVVVLLSVGLGLALRGKDAMRVLFPGLTASATPGPR